MKPGRALEVLVAQLEKVLANNKNITIESPKKLRDKTTKRIREHDVGLTIKEEHHQIIILKFRTPYEGLTRPNYYT